MNEQELVEKMCQAYFETIYGPGNWTRMDTEKDRPHRGMKAAMKVCMEARDAQWEKAVHNFMIEHTYSSVQAIGVAMGVRHKMRLASAMPERVTVEVTTQTLSCGCCHQIMRSDCSQPVKLFTGGEAGRIDAERYARGLKAELADKE
jgi:hypothetical protein